MNPALLALKAKPRALQALGLVLPERKVPPRLWPRVIKLDLHPTGMTRQTRIYFAAQALVAAQQLPRWEQEGRGLLTKLAKDFGVSKHAVWMRARILTKFAPSGPPVST